METKTDSAERRHEYTPFHCHSCAHNNSRIHSCIVQFSTLSTLSLSTHTLRSGMPPTRRSASAVRRARCRTSTRSSARRYPSSTCDRNPPGPSVQWRSVRSAFSSRSSWPAFSYGTFITSHHAVFSVVVCFGRVMRLSVGVQYSRYVPKKQNHGC